MGALAGVLATGLCLSSSRPAAAQDTDARTDDGTPRTDQITRIASPVMPATLTRPLAGPVDPDIYRLGPGDLLSLNLWGPISQTVPLEVGPEGTVFLPDMGTCRIGGQTLTRARDTVARLIASHYRGVHAELSLRRVRSMTVYLAGEVRVVGPVTASGASRVQDVLADTMFTPDGSHRNVTVHRRSGETVRFDMGRYEFTGRDDHALWLEDGDVITVPRVAEWVGVWGGVRRPGRYELAARDSLHTLLELSGGALPSAGSERALFLHFDPDGTRDSSWIAISDIASRVEDPPLHNGDNLYVFYQPEYRESPRIAVVGHVQRAGDYPIVPGTSRLSDAIALAGGFRLGADLSGVRLIRTRPDVAKSDPEFTRLAQLSREEMTESEYESFRTRLAALQPDFRVDWDRIQRGDHALDPFLAPGDIIRVDRINPTVRVDGQVLFPGVFEHRPGASWSYYIALAGGYTGRSARSKVRVTRAVNGQTVLARSLERVEPGDFVWVPERTDVSTWQRIASVLAAAGQAATIYLVFKR